jgi:hypothetical protein
MKTKATPSSVGPRPTKGSTLQRVLLGIGVVVLAGCGTVHFDAPPGQRVRLMTRDEKAHIRIQRTVWYAFWGGKPLNDNHTASCIATNRLVEVKMSTEATVLDSILNPFTGILSFSRRTLVVEGNPRPEAAP